MESDRTILHCDLNGFYASVEGLEHPELRDLPMAVAGKPKNRHGIILAKNEAAKKFGVSTGEAIWQAKRKCANLVLLEPHHEKYESYSQKVNEIYSRFTNRIEPFGIDESWLDVTESRKLFGDGKKIADTLRGIVRDELKLTISVGVSFNKVFAKLASDYKKPDATTVFDRSAMDTIRKLPARDLLFVGRHTAESLETLGIRTIGDLADYSPKLLERRFGKFGVSLSEFARGLDNSPVAFYGECQDAKSVGNSITFKRDLFGEADFKSGFIKVAEKVSARMKAESLLGNVVQITIKGADFTYMTRRMKISRSTNSISDFVDVAMRLACESWNFEKPVRMLGISASSLESASAPAQGELFSDAAEDARKKRNAAEDAFFKVRRKFGKASIGFGMSVDSDL